MRTKFWITIGLRKGSFYGPIRTKVYGTTDVSSNIVCRGEGSCAKAQIIGAIFEEDNNMIITPNFLLYIYRRLGYNVERTKKTRDGGKDIIIRKPEILGDFVYYVECKRNAENRKIGVGIVKNLHSTVTADNVNGGIIVTTSYFSKDAQNFIRNNNLGYKIKMQDFTQIKKFLSMVV